MLDMKGSEAVPGSMVIPSSGSLILPVLDLITRTFRSLWDSTWNSYLAGSFSVSASTSVYLCPHWHCEVRYITSPK